MNSIDKFTGNPLFPGKGVCDPHLRVFNDRFYVYATHDLSPESTTFTMKDWWVWSSDDLVNWKHECTLDPADTYMGAGFSSCWATDAAERNGKYYWYLSEGSDGTAVVVSDTPTGPWRDPLGKPMIHRSECGFAAHDPSILMDDDGEAYMAVGFKDYYIMKLNKDMISLAEKPRLVEIIDPVSPLGPGTLDDKPTLHKRNGIYYLSWGAYYAMSDNVYGPYRCKGSFFSEEKIAPEFRYETAKIAGTEFLKSILQISKEMGLPSTYDRHGSFFEYAGQWYFICNDHSQTNSSFFRETVIARVEYRSNGEIEPVVIDARGVPAITR